MSSWQRAELNQYCLGRCTVLSSLTRLSPGPQGLGERSCPLLHVMWRFCTLQGCRLVSTGRRNALAGRPSKYLTWCPSQVPARLSVSITVLSVVPGKHVLAHFALGVLIVPHQGTLHGSLVDAEMGGQRRGRGPTVLWEGHVVRARGTQACQSPLVAVGGKRGWMGRRTMSLKIQ